MAGRLSVTSIVRLIPPPSSSAEQLPNVHAKTDAPLVLSFFSFAPFSLSPSAFFSRRTSSALCSALRSRRNVIVTLPGIAGEISAGSQPNAP